MIDDFTAIKKLKFAFRAAMRRARKTSRSLFLILAAMVILGEKGFSSDTGKLHIGTYRARRCL